MIRQYKDIFIALVPRREGHPGLTAATRMGIALAKESQAFVTIAFLSPRAAWVPYSVFTDMPAQAIAAENRRLDAMAREGLEDAGKAATAAGVPFETESVATDFYALLTRSARKAQLHDVVIMDAASDLLPDYREIVQGMLFRSGRPIMILPDSREPGIPRNVTIAWDGSIPASRAIIESLPILQMAEEVCVVTVEGEKKLPDFATGNAGVAYLNRHGVKARQKCLSATNGDVAGALRAHVADGESDMIIMGAYAHSRFQEAILGGVTRSFLGASPVPLFMAH